MNKRIAVAFGVVCLVVGLLSLAAPAEAATTCTGTLSGAVSGPVTVPAGQTCTLNNATVSGSVSVGSNATLNSNNTTINGSVVSSGGTIHLCGGHVTGSVQASGGPAATFSTLAGDNGCPALRVDGSVILTGNANGPTVIGVSVGNGITDSGNHHGTDLERNVVGGSVSYNSNDTVGGGFNEVSSNQITGNLSCAGNNPAPIVFNNTVGGSATGQCQQSTET